MGARWAPHRLVRGRVAGKRHGREPVREEVHDEHLDDGQRHADPGEHRDDEQEDLAEVRGEQERDEGADVVVDPAALANRANDRREVVVREHDVGCLARRLGAALAHRDADIGLAEGGGVVHPIAGHRDDVPTRLPRPDETQLVRGRDPRERLGRRPSHAARRRRAPRARAP